MQEQRKKEGRWVWPARREKEELHSRSRRSNSSSSSSRRRSRRKEEEQPGEESERGGGTRQGVHYRKSVFVLGVRFVSPSGSKLSTPLPCSVLSHYSALLLLYIYIYQVSVVKLYKRVAGVPAAGFHG